LDFAIVVHWAAILISLASIAVAVVLMVAIGVQKVNGHIKTVKRLFMESLIVFSVIDLIVLVRRVLPLDEAATIIALRLLFSLILFLVAVTGQVAAIVYSNPKSSSWKDILGAIFAGTKRSIVFASFIFIVISALIPVWILPFRVELRSCSPSSLELYVPIYAPLSLIFLEIVFIAFIVYPVGVFLLAGYATKNVPVSRIRKTFAVCLISLGISTYLLVLLLSSCFPEVSDIIRIPCYIFMTYFFRRMTTFQRLYHMDLEELKEYVALMKRLLKR